MAMTKLEKKISKAVEDFYRDDMTLRIQRLIQLCNMDLNFGPLKRADVEEEMGKKFKWDGFVEATEELEDWWDEFGHSQLWFDENAELVTDTEPTGYEDEETGEWYEPEYGDFYILNTKELKRYVFGKELAPYIG